MNFHMETAMFPYGYIAAILCFGKKTSQSFYSYNILKI